MEIGQQSGRERPVLLRGSDHVRLRPEAIFLVFRSAACSLHIFWHLTGFDAQPKHECLCIWQDKVKLPSC